jgi:hypothetical protein
MEVGEDAKSEIINMIVNRKLPQTESPKVFHHDLSSEELNVSDPAIGADIEYFYECAWRLFGKCPQSRLVVTSINIIRRNQSEEVAA